MSDRDQYGPERRFITAARKAHRTFRIEIRGALRELGKSQDYITGYLDGAKVISEGMIVTKLQEHHDPDTVRWLMNKKPKS